jgi:lipoate-protein ligase A
MRRLDLTFDDPAENLAVDEALLEEAELGRLGGLLRLWQFSRPVVVLGRSSKFATEIRSEACFRAGIPVLRRTSGGGAVVVGPGCLLYSLILPFEFYPELRAIQTLHNWVMQRICKALQDLNVPAQWQGTCDVTIDQRKVSGNSVRIGRNAALYHGTVLCGMDLSLTSQFLGAAVRQPAYRQDRDHEEFLVSIATEPLKIGEAIALAFDAKVSHGDSGWLTERSQTLAAQRYRDPLWTERH